MSQPDGPEEREFEREEHYERDIDDLDVADLLADEAVEQSLIDQAETVMRRFSDIEWPKLISVYPVEVISSSSIKPGNSDAV